MNFIETKLKGCFIIEPALFADDRGYFFESFNEERFNKGIGTNVDFVQDNQSFSQKGVIRAIHYQLGANAQAKLVRVLHGTVIDVAVDLRKDSLTYGQHVAIELSAENKKQLFIPRGFGHGFSVVSETAEFFYKCDNDSTLGIDWKEDSDDIKVSEKDLILPTLNKARL